MGKVIKYYFLKEAFTLKTAEVIFFCRNQVSGVTLGVLDYIWGFWIGVNQ